MELERADSKKRKYPMSDHEQLDQLLTVLRAHGFAASEIRLSSGLKLSIFPKSEELSPGEIKAKAEADMMEIRSARAMRDLGLKQNG